MTRYEQGFLTKCAEYGIDGRRMLAGLRKRAQAQATQAQTPQVQPQKSTPAPASAAAQETSYQPPQFVGVDSDGRMVRVPKYNSQAHDDRIKEIQSQFGIVDGDQYRDNTGAWHSILQEDFGVPQGYRVMSFPDAYEFARQRMAERMQPTVDMGNRYRLQKALQQLLKDKERMAQAGKDFYGQYTPLGGRVTADTELLRALYDAWTQNQGNNEALRAALTRIGGEFQSYVTPDSPQFRARPVTVNLGDLRGSLRQARAGRPNMSAFTDRKNIKLLLKLLQD